MRRMAVWVALLIAGGALFASHLASAYPAVARQTKAACETCHSNVAGGAGLTELGTAYKADPAKTTVPTEAKATEYVGSAKCKMCHMKQHKAWLELDHAKAWSTLEKADAKVVAAMAETLKVSVSGPATQSDDCVVCHVVGFRLPGGFPAADSTKNVAVQNVGCEDCHGPGGKHVTAPMAEKKKFIAKATEGMCRQCHTSVMSPKFNFAEYSKKGVHQTAAAAAPAKTE